VNKLDTERSTALCADKGPGSHPLSSYQGGHTETSNLLLVVHCFKTLYFLSLTQTGRKGRKEGDGREARKETCPVSVLQLLNTEKKKK
jgi:hypothetical protein